jgi:hypothetical protein
MIVAGVARAVAGMSAKAIAALQPRDVMRTVMLSALRAGDFRLALAAAVDLAPYDHPKLSATTLHGGLDLGFGKLLEVLEGRRRKWGSRPESWPPAREATRVAVAATRWP